MDVRHFSMLWQRDAATTQADFWDRRAVVFNDNKKDAASGDMRARFVQWISKHIPLKDVGSILDIGCGTGHHALALGALAGPKCRVEGCDMAPKMIEFARENAKHFPMERASFRVLDWDVADVRTLGWEKAFDLVLAIRTPALGCKADLDRMMTTSRDYCAVITEASKRSTVREQLVALLYPDAVKAPETEAKSGISHSLDAIPDRASQPLYCLVNILWLTGYYPEISYMDYSWQADWSVEDVLMLQQVFFERKRALAPEQKKLLAMALHDMAVQGRVHDQVDTRVALVTWRVGDAR